MLKDPKHRLWLGAVFLWLGGVLVFCALGFGWDVDAWWYANDAVRLFTTGQYKIARPPGSPLYDYLTAIPIYYGGWWGGNLVSTVAGLGIWVGLYRLGRKAQLKTPLWTAIALMFSPLVWLNSSSTMDYVGAICLLLWAYIYLREDRWILSACFIAFSAAFRLSGALWLMPAMLFLWLHHRSLKRCFTYGSIATLTALVLFLPVFISKGFRFPVPFENSQWWYQIEMGGYFLLTMSGFLQLLILLGLYVYKRQFILQSLKENWAAEKALLVLFGVSILMYTLVFFNLPLERAYLLPLLLFLILGLDQLLPAKLMQWTAIILVSFLLIQVDLRDGPPGARQIRPNLKPGLAIEEYQGRKHQLDFREAFQTCQTERPFLLMYGYQWTITYNDNWEWVSGWEIYRRKDGQVYLSKFLLDEQVLKEIQAEGIEVLVWEQNKWAYLPHAGTQQPDLRHWFGSLIRVVDQIPCLED